MYKVGDIVEVVDDDLFIALIKVGNVAIIKEIVTIKPLEKYRIYFPLLDLYQESFRYNIKLYRGKVSKCMEIE